MSALQSGFSQNGSIIQIVANIPLGWYYAGRNRHRFREVDKLNFHGFEARIHLDVFASPDSEISPLPPMTPLRKDDGLEWEVVEGIVRIYVKLHSGLALNPELPWENTGRKNCIVWRRFLGTSNGQHFSAKLVIAFDRSDRKVPGDVREWDTQFCQGGLPTLGRRR